MFVVGEMMQECLSEMLLIDLLPINAPEKLFSLPPVWTIMKLTFHLSVKVKILLIVYLLNIVDDVFIN